MECPVDGETLVMTERSGVEIDYCPKCRGVWLDRGELDKIIDRATDGAARPVQMQPPVAAQPSQAAASHPAATPDLHGQPQYDTRRGDDRREGRRDEDRYRDSRDDRRDDRDRDYRDRDDDDRRYGKRKKRDSFLSDLFDF